MKRKKKQDAAGNSTPFFARYLEGQEETRSARVEGRKDIAYKKAESAVLATLKYPSDRDELEYHPNYMSAADVPQGVRGSGRAVTLKFPSDGDEDACYASYVNAADVPKGTAKPKATAMVRLKKKAVKR